MDYETAKKLKDAGFPQKLKFGSIVLFSDRQYIHLGAGHNGNEGLYSEKGFSCCLDEFNKEDSDVNINNHIINISDTECLLIPSLPQLIEACLPDELNRFTLDNEYDGQWVATMLLDYDLTLQFEGKGGSKEIAVANLFLELNKK